MKPHQTDHAADRFAAMRQAAGTCPTDGRGQFQIDTGTAFALEQPQATVDGARIVREREAAERAKAEQEQRQGSLF